MLKLKLKSLFSEMTQIRWMIMIFFFTPKINSNQWYFSQKLRKIDTVSFSRSEQLQCDSWTYIDNSSLEKSRKIGSVSEKENYLNFCHKCSPLPIWVRNPYFRGHLCQKLRYLFFLFFLGGGILYVSNEKKYDLE